MFKDNYQRFKKITIILLGSLIYSIAINAFIVPHRLLSGGAAGIGILLQYVFNIPSGYWVFIINLPIFIIGYKLVNKEFIFYSFIGMISMSLFLVLTKNVFSFLKVEDIFISTLLGAVVSGIGMGIIFRIGASQGGTDIIAVIIRRNKGTEMSTLYFMINSIIVGCGIFVSSLTITVYTLILMYIKSIVINKVINSFNKKQILMVITSEEEAVSKAIMTQLGRGTTYLYGEGAYTGIQRKIIYCAVLENQINKVRSIIQQIDASAMVSIIETVDVQGNGFPRPAL
ncbi:YitT family protein [Clostridium sp. YIM B02515]|uniref:YitT family protein n=1 Tax=Clostridium rhizosphaerae TaxID=2803861 RepID=A0ABS1T5J9_9CLOT|nr:YitT family protein [Clostridium rhizosphaerae]MBL4934599.1 YitT family protein [Clostridium rhizosphaerae]